MKGKTQETAAISGMSVRSARKWQSGPWPSETSRDRWWRTRPDPFDGIWEEETPPLLQGDPAGKLKATTIIEWLEERHPGRFSASQLRTLPVASLRNVAGTLAPGVPLQPVLIPALEEVPAQAHRPQRRPALWP